MPAEKKFKAHFVYLLLGYKTCMQHVIIYKPFKQLQSELFVFKGNVDLTLGVCFASFFIMAVLFGLPYICYLQHFVLNWVV